MIRSLAGLGLLVSALAPPAAAVEPMGEITANFGGESLRWETLRRESAAGSTATVQLSAAGPITMLNIHAMGDGDIGIQILYFAAMSHDRPPDGITLELTRADGRWSSKDAPRRAEIRFDILDTETGDGRAEGSFSAVLCRISEGEPENCRDIEGRVATDLGIGE
ncbi:hypothetical protein ACRDNQ_01895 [Palleronia sp. KMU-117]|uniref:hypothetical protein n=1 Tax=Palleronia sp. KMU-117 TaxID=3434108 RepID=UPI003D703514